MNFRILVILLSILSIANGLLFAQQTATPKDSTHIYERMETYTDRNKFTSFMYRRLYKPNAPKLSQTEGNKKRIQQPYSTFEGRIIRNIHIQILDPFGNSIGDTISVPQSLLTRAGNRMHIQTRVQTIKNLLLVSENQKFDALLVKESERLVRSMAYVTDVSFYVEGLPEDSDSVDLYIRELDKWTIIPGASFSESRIGVRLRDNNFLGLGHEHQHNLIWNHSTGDYAYQTKYYIPNFRNTYISSTWQYGMDEHGNFIKSVAFDRPFFSPLAKWAAGIKISQHLHTKTIWSVNNMHYKYNQQDYWAGNALAIYKGNTDYKRSTNFISSIRFTRTQFLEQPPKTIDTLQFYVDEQFYLISLGISSRLYAADKYIFKFGITEDVPVGKVIGLTSGYQIKEEVERIYIGGRYASGKYYPWGYLSSNLEYGTYFRAAKAEQGVMRAGIDHFTKLIEIGPWKFRQFVKAQFIIGLNRTDYDSLTLNKEYGLSGFNSPILSGNSRWILTSQTQFYAPWNFIGFHFGPYFNFSMGMLGNEDLGFKYAKVYSQIGLGVLIKNDHLVINTFQLSLSFYPDIPGKGTHLFVFNSFGSADFGFRDFDIGKPAPVVFR